MADNLKTTDSTTADDLKMVEKLLTAVCILNGTYESGQLVNITNSILNLKDALKLRIKHKEPVLDIYEQLLIVYYKLATYYAYHYNRCHPWICGPKDTKESRYFISEIIDVCSKFFSMTHPILIQVYMLKAFIAETEHYWHDALEWAEKAQELVNLDPDSYWFNYETRIINNTIHDCRRKMKPTLWNRLFNAPAV